jgi:hypothetical protein
MGKDADRQRLNKAGKDFWVWMTARDSAPWAEAKKAAIDAGYKDGRAINSLKGHRYVDIVDHQVRMTERGHRASARHVRNDLEAKAKKRP